MQKKNTKNYIELQVTAKRIIVIIIIIIIIITIIIIIYFCQKQ